MNRSTILRVLGGLVLATLVFSVLAPSFRSDPLEGKPAPNFTLPVAGAQGERIRLSDQRGKVLVLDFWASWCTPCRHSVPLLNRIAKRYAQDVQVLGINSESLGDGMLSSVRLNWGIQYPVLHDSAVEAQLAYNVQAFPTVMVINREGVVQKVYKGEPTEAALEAQIKRALQ
jgi:cytochrome c biogenesis protein CcmG, thiol:disulfide interchange protein DsbE